MRICKDVLETALGALSASERSCAFSSVSKQDARTAVTKFSTSLVACLAGDLQRGEDCAPLVVRAAFKGNKGGRTGGSSQGLGDVSIHAGTACSKHSVKFLEEECLIDFLVTGSDILKVELTAESEATPITPDGDLHDFDKLLLVSSPRRLFVGRVNVTKTGKTHKLDAAKKAIRARFDQALQCGHCLGVKSLEIVLLETRSDGEMAVHVCEFPDHQWQRISLKVEAAPKAQVGLCAAPAIVEEIRPNRRTEDASDRDSKTDRWLWIALLIIGLGIVYWSLFS